MSKLEAAKSIWETSTKIFDKIEESEKKEWFNSLIDELEENSSINWIKDKRNSMSEEQKEKLYKRNAITISEFLKRGSPIYQLYNAIVNWVKNTSKHWWKNALKYIMKTTGIKENHSYAFADEENDITLLKEASKSVCMINGNPKLKAVADYITFRDNNNDGLADFLELFS